ncbi:MAG: hypothetical protein M3552_06880 [Planctomycetota bacterium]|nr:hypothetical protein [Planctomycetota bacterium]
MPRLTRLTTPLAIAAAAVLLVGCVAGRQWNPFGEPPVAVLPPESSCQQVVAHLNSNIERCTGWRSTDLSVRSNGSVLSATASIAVESPNRFRMLVMAFGTDVADLGSNDERMWMWMRPPADEPSYVLTCAHCDLAVAQRRMPIPFRPDWLMEVLGVIPFDPAAFELEPASRDAGEFLLVSNQTATDGTPVTRRIYVDARRGVITGHALWATSPDGQVSRMVAEAKLSDHRRDERTGVMLPHKIELSYPDAQAEMTLAIKTIEVNPTGVSPSTWQPSVAASYPWRDLATDKIVTIEKTGPY